ncbi:uncharacterized protein ACNLHF_010164 [Anomaloglossus baeobatrachus]|uniref:uncharacterized protein LOC142289715 n=1 Tax=Anomaloglossus baeobatrachus TaxID=238106 RepID=UPI003F50B1F6
MYSRSSALFLIVCTVASWNVKATTGITPTNSHSHSTASISTENLPPDTPAFTSGDTFYPLLNASSNSTFNDSSTITEHSTLPSLVTISPPLKNSSETGSTSASTTLHLSSAVSETGDISSTIIASTTLHSSTTASKTGQVSSSVSNSNITKSVLPTQESSIPQRNATTLPLETNATVVSDKKMNGMKYSETVLTSIFSTILVVVLLTTLAFCFNKYRKQRSQYSHHPLHENIYESEGYTPPDDTLVISGGLYDAPRIYNPNMTVLEEEDSPPDYISFSNRPGQFRLEFLPGDKDIEPGYNGSLRRNV